jgi:hypothetical protein
MRGYHFHWHKPAGRVDGYYFGIIGGALIGFQPTCPEEPSRRICSARWRITVFTVAPPSGE